MNPTTKFRKFVDQLFAALLTMIAVGSLIAVCDDIARAFR